MGEFQILGYVAAALTTFANLPQAIKMIKTQSVEDVSTLTYSMLLAGLVCWVIYGFMQEDWPLIIANSVSSIITAVVLLLKLLPKKKIEEISDKMP